jgi:nucleoside 2-deoxyribosyltransferase
VRYRGIYLAGPWARREEVRAARDKFTAAGVNVKARWIDLSPTPEDEKNPVVLTGEAINDLEDLDNADAVVVLNLEKSEGKAVETGYALAAGVPVIIIGERTNVFHYLPEVSIVETIEEAIALCG